MRSTKIICTLGPASDTKEQVERLVSAGMNIARINLSHGTRDDQRRRIRQIKELRGSDRTALSVMLDTQGAEIRTGDVPTPVSIRAGEEVIFAPSPPPGEKRTVILVNYDAFSKDVREASSILIDNGELLFDLVEVREDGSVLARAQEAGKIGSRRHVNLPGATIDLPSITEKDWSDIAFAVEEGVDFIALSFIRSAAEIEEVIRFLRDRKSDISVVAKIETKQAVDDVENIIHTADGIMVARGDLGAEVPFESVPVMQDEIVARAREHGKPVIVATHMLESMIHLPTPTRAEVTDIAHAATTRADATMLSAETAMGRFPLLALQAMDRVLQATEQHLARFVRADDVGVRTERDARAEAAVTLARSTNAAALVVITRTGQTAKDIARFRPTLPIIAFTEREEVQRSMQLHYGITPLVTTLQGDPENTVLAAFQEVRRRGLLQADDRVVLVSDAKAHELPMNTIQLRSLS
jgi:pyruvate kinase